MEVSPISEQNVAACLQAMRVGMRVSREQLSQQLAWPLAQLTAIEEGTQKPTFTQLNAYVRYFGAGLSDVLCPDNTELGLNKAFTLPADMPELTLDQVAHLAHFRTIVRNYIRMDALSKRSD
jgi:hypothetical protein